MHASTVRRVGIVLLAAKVALVPLVFDPAALVPFALPKAILSEALSYGLLAVLLGLMAQFGRRFWIPSAVHWGVLGYLAAYVISSVFALDRYLAVFGSHERLLGALSVLDVTIFYFALTQIPRTRADVRLLAGAALAAGAIAIAYGVMQRVGIDPIGWESSLEVRPVGTLGNATVFGHYLAVLSAGALALALRGGASRNERLGLLGFAAIAYSVGLLSGTRSALLALPVLAALLALRGTRLLTPEAPRVARVIVPLAVLAVLALGTVAGGDRLLRLVREGADDPSVVARVILYEVAASSVRDRPVTGAGPDNFEVVYPRYRPERAGPLGMTAGETSAHGWIAKLATDAGLLGLAAFVSLVGLLVTTTLRRGLDDVRFLGWGLITTHLVVGSVTVTDVATEWLMWAGVAAVARGAADVAPGEGAPSRSSRGGNVLPAVLLGGALILGLFSLPSLSASHDAQASRAYLSLGRPERALSAAQSAIAADPRRAIYWHNLGVASARLERFRESARAFSRGAELAPHDAAFLGNLARAEVGLARQGDADASARALEAARKGVILNPNDPQTHLAMAVAQLNAGDSEQAAQESERGLQLARVVFELPAYEIAARAYLDIGRHQDVVRWADLGLLFVVEADPAGNTLRLLSAQALHGLGDDQSALRRLDIILESEPGNTAARRLRDQIRAATE